MERVVLKPGRYSLYSDKGCGDSGPVLHPVDRNSGSIASVGDNGEIRVGMSVLCGSLTARTYNCQDWWLTTAVEEIVEVNEDRTEVKFRTHSGTLYTAKLF